MTNSATPARKQVSGWKSLLLLIMCWPMLARRSRWLHLLEGSRLLILKSDEPGAQTAATQRFKRDSAAQTALANTLKLADVSSDDYDAVFYPGGHGPLWDLAEDRHSIALIEAMYAAGKPVAAVCHAPAVLRHAKAPDGSPLVKGKSVTGFSNTEEDAVQLSGVVPFMLEDELKAKGANYSRADDWQPHAVTDGNLITGQNPASSELVAKAVLEQMK